MTNKPRRVLLGEIGAAHGIRGDVSVKTYTAKPEDIAAYGPLTDEHGRRTFELNVVRVTPKGLIVRVKGIDDRTTVETLRNIKLYVERERLPAVADGEFYHEDLIGLRAVAPGGTALGIIVAVQNYGAGDMLEIRREGGTATELIPFTNACVPEVDLARGEAVVIIPELVGEEEPASADGAGETGLP
jgi:16S rRNA processing protein RimM